jgi:predicted amidophosphoribosyltransferase
MSVANTLAPLVDFVFPPRCPLCGEGIAAQAGVCVGCWQELVIPGKPACEACSLPFASGALIETRCGECRAHPPRHDGIAAATIYNEASRKLVLAFKHGNRIALAPMMARLLSARLAGVDSDWLVVPVPLHRWRLWQRGFNQAAVLAGGPRRYLARRECSADRRCAHERSNERCVRRRAERGGCEKGSRGLFRSRYRRGVRAALMRPLVTHRYMQKTGFHFFARCFQNENARSMTSARPRDETNLGTSTLRCVGNPPCGLPRSDPSLDAPCDFRERLL